MPPSIFRGRPWPAPGEPLWLEGDRDEAVALVLFDWDTCPGCRQPLSETIDPDAEGRYDVEQLMCAGCQAREVYAEREHYRGRMLRVRRKAYRATRTRVSP